MGFDLSGVGADWTIHVVRPGPVSGPIWLEITSSYYCNDLESHLLDCHKDKWDQNSCSHDQDVTVQCTGLTFHLLDHSTLEIIDKTITL